MKRRIRDTMSTSGGRRPVARELALTLTAAVGLLIFGAGAVLMAFGMKPLVFLSGSMSPHIGTGALALTISMPAAELSEGDVISFLRSDGARVTHRITAITPEGQSFKVTTRGDANDFDDPDPSYLTSADRVFWHLEGAGAVLTEATKFQYAFPFGVLVGMTALYGFRRKSPAEPATAMTAGTPEQQDTGDAEGNEVSPGAHKPRRGTKALGVAAAAVVGCLTVGAAGPTAPVGTLAAFSDGGSNAGSYSSLANFLAPAVVDAGTITCSSTKTLLGTDVTFKWQAPVGTVTKYDTELMLENLPLLYHEKKSSTATTVTYSLSAELLSNGPYRFAVTAVNGYGTNGTAYKTVNYSGSTVTCS